MLFRTHSKQAKLFRVLAGGKYLRFFKHAAGKRFPSTPAMLTALFVDTWPRKAKLALENHRGPRYVEEMAMRFALASPVWGCSSVG